MRNLKKFLALVLAMMMVFGLMVTANAASYGGFSDADKMTEKYQQAAELITALGVMRGYGTAFGPTDTLTRAQFAAVLYRLDTGRTGTVEDNDPVLAAMKDSDGYDDVPVGEWSAGHINYATTMGLLTGYGSNKFGPSDPVTVVQMLTGVLRVLGLEEKTTGNWEMDTIVAATKYGLADKLSALSGVATREMIAQIAYNALTHGDTVTTTETRFVIMPATGYATTKDQGTAKLSALFGSNYATVEEAMDAVAGTDYTSPVYGTDYTFDIANVTVTSKKNTLLETKFGVVESTTAATDAYGRPVTAYVDKDGEIIVSAAATPAYSSPNGFTGNELYNKLGSATIIIDSVISPNNSYTRVAQGDTYTTVTGGRVNNSSLGGNGVTVEIYKTATKNVYKAVIIAPALAKVTSIETYKATLTTGARTEYVIGGITMKEFVNPKATDRTNVALNDEIAVDDYVIVDISMEFDEDDNPVPFYEISKVETKKGTATKYDSATKTFTIGGEKVTASEIAVIDGSALSATTADGKEKTFVWDGEGRVIATVTTPTTGTNVKYIFTLDVEEGSFIVGNKVYGDTSSKYYKIIGIDKDGKPAEYVVSSVKGHDGNQYTYNGTNNLNAKTVVQPANENPLLVYADDATDGNLKVLTASKNSAYPTTDNVYESWSNGKNTASFTINSSVNLGTYGGSNKLYASESTKYYVVESDDDDFIVTTYIGYTDVGNINSANANIAAVDIGKDGVADIVFVYLKTGTATKANYAYVTDKDYSYDSATKIYTYQAYVNGNLQDLELTSRINFTLPALVKVNTSGSNVTAARLSTGNDNGSAVTSAPAISSLGSALLTSAVTVTYTANDYYFINDGGLLKYKTTSNATSSTVVAPISASAKLYTVKGGEMIVSDLSKLAKTTTISGASIVFVSDGTQVIAIYVDEEAESVATGKMPSGTTSKTDEVTAEDDVILDGSRLETGSVEAGADVDVKNGGSLHAEDGIKEGSNVKTDDIGNVTTGENGTFDEAVEYEPGEGAANGGVTDLDDAQDGSIFEMDGDKAGRKDATSGELEQLSSNDRHEFVFIFSIPESTTPITGYTVTLTHRESKRTLQYEVTLARMIAIGDIKDSSTTTIAGKKFAELVCAANINDGDPNHNRYKDTATGSVLAGAGEENKLAEGYWTVKIVDSASREIFKGGFTVTAADRTLKS